MSVSVWSSESDKTRVDLVTEVLRRGAMFRDAKTPSHPGRSQVDHPVPRKAREARRERRTGRRGKGGRYGAQEAVSVDRVTDVLSHHRTQFRTGWRVEGGLRWSGEGDPGEAYPSGTGPRD